MKIYTEVNYELKDGELVEVSSKSFDYEGEVAQCGKGTSKSTGTTYTSPIPKWAEKEHKYLMKQAADEAYKTPYAPYVDEYGNPIPTIAGFSPEEMAAQQARVGAFAAGDPYGASAVQMADIAAATPFGVQDVSSGYSAGQYNPAMFGNYGSTKYDSGEFGAEQAAQYMDPYWSNVAEDEMSAAREEFARGRIGTEAERVAEGSRGGYRSALEDIMGRSEEAETIAGIRGRAAKSAYESAQQQYERDRSGRMAAGRMTEDSLQNAQARFQSDRQAYMEATRLGDESAMNEAKMNMEASKYNADMVMKQAQEQRAAAQMYSGLGDTASARMYKRIEEMERAGATQREMNQAVMDEQKRVWKEQQDFKRERLNWMSGMLSGAPTLIDSGQRPLPGLASQLAGLGAAYGGLQGLFTGGNE